MPGKGDQAFQAESLYGRQPEMTFGGALSFLRRRYTREIGAADVVVSGLPFDAATTNRPGARFGPAAIRGGSTQLAELEAFPWGFDPFDRLAVADYGDCFLDIGFPDQAAPAIEAHARDILEAGPRMLTFGGDHFVTWPLLRAHAARYGPLALVQFDAHPDTWDDDGRRIDHGTMIRRAIDDSRFWGRDFANAMYFVLPTGFGNCASTDAPFCADPSGSTSYDAYVPHYLNTAGTSTETLNGGGTNAAVVGILGAALYDPVWTSAVSDSGDFAVALTAFLLLAVWRLPAWLIVVLTVMFTLALRGVSGLAGV